MQLFIPYIAEIFVLSGIASAVVIATDLRSCPQPMRIMNSVWILTGLWAGVFALLAYYGFGRQKRCREQKQMHEDMNVTMDKSMNLDMPMNDSMKMDMPTDKPMDKPMNMTTGKGMELSMDMGSDRPKWQSSILSTLHCGAGCTLADMIGEWFMYFVPIAIGGSLIAGSWVVDYLLALTIGIAFQYLAIRGMEQISKGKAIVRAAKADVLSLTAWQVGMYGWMAVVFFVLAKDTTLPRDTFSFWFMMQIAMCCGFLVALPMNVLLIWLGIKKGM